MEKEKLDKMYDICFFDLDGTIIDSSPGPNGKNYINSSVRRLPIRSPDSMDLTMRKAGRRWSITGNIIRIRGFLSARCIPDLKNH